MNGWLEAYTSDKFHMKISVLWCDSSRECRAVASTENFVHNTDMETHLFQPDRRLSTDPVHFQWSPWQFQHFPDRPYEWLVRRASAQHNFWTHFCSGFSHFCWVFLVAIGSSVVVRHIVLEFRWLRFPHCLLHPSQRQYASNWQCLVHSIVMIGSRIWLSV